MNTLEDIAQPLHIARDEALQTYCTIIYAKRMNGMNQVIPKFGEDYIVITDPEEAQYTVLQLGRHAFMKEQMARTGRTALMIHSGHPTHWCLCMLHPVRDDGARNVFNVLAYAKRRYEFREVEGVLNTILQSALRVDTMAAPDPASN